MPFFGAIGAWVLGSGGAAAAGAGVTAAVGVATTAAVAGGIAASVYSSSASSTAAAKSRNAQDAYMRSLTGTVSPTTTVDANSTNVNQLGRAALISTSPQGVQGTDTSMRYKLLGNSPGLGN